MKNGQIYEVKSTYILQPGPAALTEGVRQLHDIIRRAVTQLDGTERGGCAAYNGSDEQTHVARSMAAVTWP